MCRTSLLILLLPLVSSLAHSTHPQASCTAFSWAVHSPGAEQAAMLVEAHLDEHPLRLQLDTGSDISALYHQRNGGHVSLQGRLRLGSLDLGEQHFVDFSHIPAGAAEGVIGLDSLIGHQILIDYPARTLCVTTAPLAGEWLEIPSRLRHGKLFLFSRVGEHLEWGFFFDTGASLYHLLVDKANWQALTGRTGDEEDNQVLYGSGWGSSLTTVGAPLTMPLHLGPLQAEAPSVHFVLEQPARFTDHPARARGLIGSAPFLDHAVRIDLRGSTPFFGVRRH